MEDSIKQLTDYPQIPSEIKALLALIKERKPAKDQMTSGKRGSEGAQLNLDPDSLLEILSRTGESVLEAIMTEGRVELVVMDRNVGNEPLADTNLTITVQKTNENAPNLKRVDEFKVDGEKRKSVDISVNDSFFPEVLASLRFSANDPSGVRRWLTNIGVMKPHITVTARGGNLNDKTQVRIKAWTLEPHEASIVHNWTARS